MDDALELFSILENLLQKDILWIIRLGHVSMAVLLLIYGSVLEYKFIMYTGVTKRIMFSNTVKVKFTM